MTMRKKEKTSLKELLGEEDYEELRLQRLYQKAASGEYMPSLYDWLKKVNPDYNWDWRHTKYIIDHLQKVSDGEIRKLMIFTPPRHGKTELASIHFPTYFLEKNPKNRIILGTYNQTLANKISRRIRALCKTRIELDPDRKAMEEWDTKDGGGCRAVGVGAGVAGVGANLIIIDDPIRSRRDATSKTVRDTTYSWYTDDIFTRSEPDSRIVLIMTLWHEDDLAGRIQSLEKDWTIIRLPALAEENDPLGRQPGEALCPDRYTREQLLETKDVMGRSFYALYQQRPQEQEGEFFKASWFIRDDRVPEAETSDRFEFVRFWDKAATLDGDYTVGVLMMKNRATKQYYILDVVRGRWLPFERDKTILRTAQKDQELYGHVRIFHEEEPGSSGKDAARQTNTLLAGYSVKAIRSTGNKQLRAEPYQSQAEAGNVHVLAREWTPDFLDEHATFPNGTHDDIVDAASGAFKQLSRGGGGISFTRR
jgi:predicted phage terminase large subunit-like protein